jgi:hypothetical protein
MTIRIATVNGTDAETAARNGVLQIRASNKNVFDLYDLYKFTRGTIQGFSNAGLNYIRGGSGINLPIPSTIWGDPVVSIGKDAFKNTRLASVTIPNSVISIGEGAFRDNKITKVVIPGSVTSIGDAAFRRHHTESGENHCMDSITIGANVAMIGNPFGDSWRYYSDGKIHEGIDDSFQNYYTQNGKKAGTYTFNLLKNMGNVFVKAFTLGSAGTGGGWGYSP